MGGKAKGCLGEHQAWLGLINVLECAVQTVPEHLHAEIICEDGREVSLKERQRDRIHWMLQYLF